MPNSQNNQQPRSADEQRLAMLKRFALLNPALAETIEHERTKDSQGRSKIYPQGEFIEGGWGE